MRVDSFAAEMEAADTAVSTNGRRSKSSGGMSFAFWFLNVSTPDRCPKVCAVIFATISCAILSITSPAATDDQRGLNGLAEIEFAKLSDRNISALGTAALAISAGDWKHAETANFVYHFFHGFMATAVSIEAEFYYRVIAKELDRDTTQWERKGHIYIFENAADWRTFQSKAQLDPWTGGIHSGNDLFIVREPGFKFKGRTLGHEIAHLVLHRFFGAGVPLWLNEGYAEYASIRGYASYQRARGYAARPASQAVPPAEFIAVRELTDLVSYPADEKRVAVFYIESEKLVRFLSAESKPKFVALLEAMATGNKFDTALSKSFGGRFITVDALDQEFQTYATKDAAVAKQE